MRCRNNAETEILLREHEIRRAGGRTRTFLVCWRARLSYVTPAMVSLSPEGSDGRIRTYAFAFPEQCSPTELHPRREFLRRGAQTEGFEPPTPPLSAVCSNQTELRLRTRLRLLLPPYICIPVNVLSFLKVGTLYIICRAKSITSAQI